jgi:hypothetical protein
MLASTTEYRFLVSSITGPYIGLVGFAFVVAGDACIEFVTTKVLDGDDVEG